MPFRHLPCIKRQAGSSQEHCIKIEKPGAGLERFILTPFTTLPQHPLHRELGLSKTPLVMSRETGCRNWGGRQKKGIGTPANTGEVTDMTLLRRLSNTWRVLETQANTEVSLLPWSPAPRSSPPL